MVEKKSILEAAKEVETIKVEEAVQTKLETAYRLLCKTREELLQNSEKSVTDAHSEYEKSFQALMAEKEGKASTLELEKQFVNSQFETRKNLEDGYQKANDDYVQTIKNLVKETNLQDAELSSIAEVSRLIWSFSNID